MDPADRRPAGPGRRHELHRGAARLGGLATEPRGAPCHAGPARRRRRRRSSPQPATGPGGDAALLRKPGQDLSQLAIMAACRSRSTPTVIQAARS